MCPQIDKTIKLAYSVAQVSESTSLSKAYLRNQILAGNLKIQRFGRRVLILPVDLTRFLNRDGGVK